MQDDFKGTSHGSILRLPGSDRDKVFCQNSNTGAAFLDNRMGKQWVSVDLNSLLLQSIY